MKTDLIGQPVMRGDIVVVENDTRCLTLAIIDKITKSGNLQVEILRATKGSWTTKRNYYYDVLKVSFFKLTEEQKLMAVFTANEYGIPLNKE